MRLQRVIELVDGSPWFITPQGLAAVRAVIGNKLLRNPLPSRPVADGNGDDEDDMSPLMGMFNMRPKMEIDPNNVAHIYVQGTLGQGLSKIEKSCATDYEDIIQEIKMAVGSGVRGIFLCMDSSGGTVAGNAEAVEAVQNAGVPVMAYAKAYCCSAAYNIAASAKWIWASQSATIGSIGVLIPWIDSSRCWDMEGMRFDPITNTEGDLKSAMHGPSLTPDQRAALQEYCQDAFEAFKGNVLRNRSVPDSAMRGQAFFAARGMQNNLCDEIGTKEEAYAAFLAKLGS